MWLRLLHTAAQGLQSSSAGFRQPVQCTCYGARVRSAVLGHSLRKKHALAARCASACCRCSSPGRRPARPSRAATAAAALPLHGLSDSLLHGGRLLVILIPRWQRLRRICTPQILVHGTLSRSLPILLRLLLLPCHLPARRLRLLCVMLVKNVQRACPPNIPEAQLAVTAAGGQLPFIGGGPGHGPHRRSMPRK